MNGSVKDSSLHGTMEGSGVCLWPTAVWGESNSLELHLRTLYLPPHGLPNSGKMLQLLITHPFFNQNYTYLISSFCVTFSENTGQAPDGTIGLLCIRRFYRLWATKIDSVGHDQHFKNQKT
jgi:hypothetical protein